MTGMKRNQKIIMNGYAAGEWSSYHLTEGVKVDHESNYFIAKLSQAGVG